MFWDQSAGEFAFERRNFKPYATVVATTDYADLHIGGLTADDASSFGGDVSVTGDVSASADLLLVTLLLLVQLQHLSSLVMVQASAV